MELPGLDQVLRPSLNNSISLVSALPPPISPVKVVQMILILVFNSCFLAQSLVGHGLNRKNESKVFSEHAVPRRGEIAKTTAPGLDLSLILVKMLLYYQKILKYRKYFKKSKY